MTRYRIADLLPLAWRQVMVAAGPYAATWPIRSADPDNPWRVPAPRNAAGYCPLGALHGAGLVCYVRLHKHPTAATALAALAATLDLPYNWRSLVAVREFILAWDYGEITDLAAALGLSPEPAAAGRGELGGV
jgi:hypothetical protein